MLWCVFVDYSDGICSSLNFVVMSFRFFNETDYVNGVHK